MGQFITSFRRARLRTSVAALTAGMVFMPTVSSAQCTLTTTLPSGAATGQDACRKAQDLFSFIVPQVGVALAGGNPVLGEGGTLGGWPKRAFALRLSAVDGGLPANDVEISTGNAVSSDFGSERAPIPVPSLDGAIGIFKGVPLGLTNVGGVDLLVGVTYLPTLNEDDFQVTPQGGGFGFGYGVRVGALQESSLIPGVSVSFMRRTLPTTDIGYASESDSLLLQNTALSTNSLRIVASKRLVFLGLAAGVGRDEIEGTSSLLGVINENVLNVNQRASVTTPLGQKVTRNTAFVNASFSLVIARIVAEYGWSGSDEVTSTLNTFGNRRANEGYRYGSVGIAFRF